MRSFLILAIFSALNIFNCRHVFFDVKYTGSDSKEKIERIVMRLHEDIVPRTCENFISLVKGFEKNGKVYGYKGSIFHRIIPKFMIQGGDIINRNGTGSFSIYGKRFADENFKMKHYKPGILSMANAGPNTNGSQFFITIAKTQWLDGKHVVFGEVLKSSMDTLNRISEIKTDSMDLPLENVTIVDCGVLQNDKKEYL